MFGVSADSRNLVGAADFSAKDQEDLREGFASGSVGAWLDAWPPFATGELDIRSWPAAGAQPTRSSELPSPTSSAGLARCPATGVARSETLVRGVHVSAREPREDKASPSGPLDARSLLQKYRFHTESLGLYSLESAGGRSARGRGRDNVGGRRPLRRGECVATCRVVDSGDLGCAASGAGVPGDGVAGRVAGAAAACFAPHARGTAAAAQAGAATVLTTVGVRAASEVMGVGHGLTDGLVRRTVPPTTALRT